MKSLRHLWATLAVLLAAAGCATAPRVPLALPAPGPAGFPLAPASLAQGGQDDEDVGRERSTPISIDYDLQTEADELGPPTASQILRALAQRAALVTAAVPVALAKSAGLQPSQWQALGPSNVGGRVRALAFDPRNAARLLAGTASGGLWISENAGASWHANNDFFPNLSITSLVFDPSNPSVVYLGTGEASAGLVGVGVFKSTDGGLTWQYLAATNPDLNADWRFVNRLAIDPAQPQVVLAGVTNASLASGGIYRSTDSGASWTRVAALKALDLAFDPNNASNALAGLDDGTLAYSRDAGATWTHTAALVAPPAGEDNTARAEIAFARSQPGLVYASLDNNKGEVWSSRDSGATWSKLSNPQHLNSQGGYDNAIWVDPLDATHVVVAGLDIYQSRDGGLTFTKVSDWRNAPASPHADHHALAAPPDFGPSNMALFDGNDGGVYKAANILSATGADSIFNGWTNLDNGLAVTQFYGGAGRTAAGGRIVGGTQDNGSLVLSGNTWMTFKGGDGGFVAVDPVSDQTLYGEYVYAALHRSLDGGFSSSYICDGITEALPNDGAATYCGTAATKKANFIAPFVLDPNNANRILAGANSLWANDNARGVPAWRAIKAPTPAITGGDNFINAIAVQEGNSNVVWVGYNDGQVFRSLDALSATPTWARVGQQVLPARRVQRITIDRDNPNRVILAFTGFVPANVWQTLDGGATWSSAVSGNLPYAPVFDVKRHPANPDWLYAATSVGVFTSENGGATWATTNEGPANIRVRELFWIDGTTLGAATFGRGMFKIAVASGGPDNYQDLWWDPQENGWGMSITQHGAMIFAALFVYDPQGQPVWVVMPGGTWDAGLTSFTGPLYIPSGSWFGSYDTSRFAVGAPVGTATIAFSSLGNATLTYTIKGVAGTKPIQRQNLGPADSTPVASYGDLWWGGSSQNGWGVAINQQYRNLFAVWYTYDASGRTTWYTLQGGSWTAANVYSAPAYRTTSSAWLGVPYDPSALNARPAGNVTFTFTDANNAIMSYTVDGVTGSKAITRQPF